MQTLDLLNPWWENRECSFQEANYKKRFVYEELLYWLDKGFIVSLSGLRRLGKTTIFMQFIQELLKRNIEQKKIFLYQFRESDNDLEEVLTHYFTTVLNENFHGLTCYIFLDELQYVEKWQEILKFYYDINKNIHFFVSGSSSLLLHEDTKESLAGRIMDFYIYPMGFHEYLFFTRSVRGRRLDLFHEDLWSNIKEVRSDFDTYKNEFSSYLHYGEFPQIIEQRIFLEARKYFTDSVIDKIFNRDIQIFHIEKRKELRMIYKILCQQTAQFINKSNIAREVALSQITVTNYIEVLQKAFLINYNYNYLRSITAQEKSYKKAYVTSINLLGATLNIDDVNSYVYPDFKGHIIETYVFNRLNQKFKDCLYFYNKDKKEVDIVIEKGLSILPIEVKIKTEIRGVDLRHLIDFMDKRKLERGIVVYGGPANQLQFDNKNIFLIPYYLLD